LLFLWFGGLPGFLRPMRVVEELGMLVSSYTDF
jgi:hypothetical protein